MRFALLGKTDLLTDLAQAIQQHPTHQLVPSDRSSTSNQAFEVIDFSQSWESLLVDSSVDAIIFSAKPEDPLAQEALLKIVREGMPVLVVHPGCSAIDAFQLEMVQRDVGKPLMPYHPAANHPALRFLQTAISDAELQGDEENEPPLGTLEQIVMRRPLAQRDRCSVWYQFARDADLLQQVAGRVVRLTATGPSHDAANYGELCVTLACQSGLTCRWSVEPSNEPAQATLSLLGSKGCYQLELADADHQASLTHLKGETSQPVELPATDAPTDALQRFTDLCAHGDDGSDWANASRALELADTVTLSLRKRRAIELYGEEHSEDQTFQGIMAAGGCFLLLLILGLMVVLTILDGLQLGFTRHAWFHKWPALLLAVLGIFLLLQLFRMATPKRTTEDQGESADFND